MEFSKLILKSGYTPKLLAEEIGGSKFAIYAYTSGRAFPRDKKLKKISKALGVSENAVIMAIAESRKVNLI